VSLLLIVAIVSMFLALIFYTLGVWGERRAKTLKKIHLIFFWLGFVFDTTGTSCMAELAGSWKFSLHTATGLLAIILMAVHAVWASLVLYKNDEKAKQGFHRFSLFVWIIWLIPFVSGMILGMSH